MIGRLCAAQMARQIVRALHVAPPEPTAQRVGQLAKRKKAKTKRKRKAA